MRYLLDTDICIYIANRRSRVVLDRFRALRQGDVGMSVVTYAELSYGVRKSRRSEENAARLEELSRFIPVQPFCEDSAREYGRIRAHLESVGHLIGPYDMMIAAHALSLGLILVTSNQREFRHVPGLSIENWTKS